MNHSVRVVRFSLALLAVLAVVVPAAVQAHFQLLEPASWVVENQLGDPQKLAPCGSAPPAATAAPTTAAATAPAVTLTNAVTKLVGGSKLHLKVAETIYHPGHFRVALAVNSRTELPADPYTTERTTERGPQSVWAVIQSPPQIPVIADGLFQHYTRPAAPAAPQPAAPAAGRGQAGPPQIWETDIQLPNISCTKCTLQIIQFMAEHGYNMPGGYSYHHCADVQITADSAKPTDKGWPAAQ